MSDPDAHVVDFATLPRAPRLVTPLPQPAPVAEAPKLPKRAPKPKASKPVDVIKLARKRLREVRREIGKLEKLRAEEDQLTRLLNAADNIQEISHGSI